MTKKIRGIRYRLLTAVSISMLGIAQPAWAQDAQPAEAPAPEAATDAAATGTAPAEQSQVGDIVVTAQRRSESVQDVPISITVFGGELLERANINRLDEIRSRTPNLYFGELGGSVQGAPTIRGISSVSGGIAFDPAVAVYVDGVYLGRPDIFSMELFDIERIEVLRGPQGTLYGRNAVGGAINVISSKPDNDFTGALSAGYARFDELRLKGQVSGPLIEDKLFAGVAGSFSRHDGDYTNDFDGEDLNSGKSRALRGVVRAEPVDDLTLTLVADWSKDTGTGIQVNDNIGDGTDPTAALPVGFLFGYQEQDPFDRHVSIDFTPKQKLKQYGFSGTIDYDFGDGFRLTSITAYRDFAYEIFSDADRIDAAIFNSGFEQDVDQFSQEIRLATPADKKLSAVAGVYYFTQTARETTQVFFEDDFARLVELMGGLPANILQDQGVTSSGKIKSDSYAVFGEATYRPTDELSFTLGGRFSREEKKLNLAQTVSGTPFPVIPGLFGFTAFDTITDDYEENDFSPAVGVRYEPNRDLMFYGKVSRGFKSGGFNSRLPDTNPDGTVEDLSFDSESIMNYEIGVKADFFDKKLRTNIAIFRMDHKDKQVTSFDGTRERTDNAAKVRTTGFEAEIYAVPAEGLTFNLGVGYVDAENKKFLGPLIDPSDPTSGQIDYSGLRPTNTPDWTITSGIEYVQEVGSNSSLRFRGEYAYVGEVFFTPENDPELGDDGHSLFNARLSFLHRPTGLEVTGYVENIFDKKYAASGFSQVNVTGLKHIILGAPRTYGVTLRKSF